MNKVSRMGLRPPAMLARFMDEPLLQGSEQRRRERRSCGDRARRFRAGERGSSERSSGRRLCKSAGDWLFRLEWGRLCDVGVDDVLDRVDLTVEDLDHRPDRGFDAGLVGLMGAAAFGLTRGRSIGRAG